MIRNAAALLQVMRNLRLSPPALSRNVERRLFRILVTAHRHVPYYREIMKAADYDPAHDFQGGQDLGILPVLTKEIIKDRGEAAFVDERLDRSKCIHNNTSGSTGIPLQIYRDAYSQSMIFAKYFRVLLVNGYRFNDKVLGFRPQKTPVIEEGGFLRHLGLLRWRKVNLKITPQAMVDHLLGYEPDFLYGNLVNFEMMVQELERRGIRYEKMRGLFPGGEVVTAQHRRRLKEFFQAPVAVTYGSNEMGIMAFDTPEDTGLRLCEDTHYFEFLDDDWQPAPAGRRCRLITTDLSNEVMPFIRYDHEDWVTPAPSVDESGQHWRRLLKVDGRANETFSFSDGSLFTFLVPGNVLKMYPGVRQFRVIQKKRDQLHVLLAGESGYVESVRDQILVDFKSRVPRLVDLVIEQVDSLPPDANGKLRVMVSEVDD